MVDPIHKETDSKKRGRNEASSASTSKACREKLRRDRLNDKFMELSALVDSGKSPSTDKSSILVSSIKTVDQMRSELRNLKNANSSLQERAEKSDLRDEKQRLRSEKEKLEKQLNAMEFIPPQMGNKVAPFACPGVAMWQFMPPASVDTSQDHALRPPVA